MSKGIILLVLFAAILVVPDAISGSRTTAERATKHRYFDDYLVSVSQPREFNQVLKQVGGRTDEGETGAGEDIVQDVDVIGYFRDVPREHWSCCMLGKLAGDKGFHCQVSFYATRIARRNYNRAHTRRMLFHGPDPIINWGRDLMTTFSRCIQEDSTQFHDCCYTTTIERRERRRWQMYRHIEEVLPDS